MGSSVLNIGKSALLAAQVGIETTGHNIANANTPGYTRQVVVQAAAQAQNQGTGFVGQGTSVSTVLRQFSEILTAQVSNGQSTTEELKAYFNQMSAINNMLSNVDAGMSPAIQDFFKKVQAAASNPGDSAARQSMLSSAQALSSRFQSIGKRFEEINDDVNSQLANSITKINSYASQISKLNASIENAQSADGQPPNDLLDQRDQIISELSKLMKVSVVKQDGTNVNVFIGNGLPLVVGKQTYTMSTLSSSSDPSRLELAIQTSTGSVTPIANSSIAGGSIGGLIQYRESLDSVRSQFGMIAYAVADAFNTQHRQGLDATGLPGGSFFNTAGPSSTPNTNNTGNGVLNANITNLSALTGSNYKIKYDGTNYTVTRLSDSTTQSFTSLPQTVDGVNISLASGTFASGDEYLIKPTTQAASQFTVAINNVNKIALGAPPVSSAATTGNTGSGVIGSPTVSSNYSGSPLGSAFTLTYNSAGGTLTGFPATQPVTVTNGSTTTTIPAGSPVPYTAGATYTVGGVSFTMSGTPANGDTFTLTPNTTNNKGDNRNALKLASLQSNSLLLSGTQSFEGVLSQLVSQVGNKTNELKVTSAAETKMLEYNVAQQQSFSGVNLDEEAANLLRYQQAYQAAGKLMQIAKEMFDSLITLG